MIAFLRSIYRSVSISASIAAALLVMAVAAPSSRAQNTSATIIADGETIQSWNVAESDSLVAQASTYVDSLRRAGFYYAQIDSISERGEERVAHISRGDVFEVGALTFAGVDGERAEQLRTMMDTRVGRVLDLEVLEQDLKRVLESYAQSGRPLATATVQTIEQLDGSRPQIGITIYFDEGPTVWLKRIELEGAERTDPSLVARFGGLKIGEPLEGFDPDHIQRKIEGADFFESVGLPELSVEADSGAVLRIPIDEGDPGTFDLVFGYLPPQSEGERGTIVGNGHLALRNLFGQGRALSLRLNRLPDEASSVDVVVSDPFVLGLPLGLSAGFHGIEQDSTYGKRSYQGEMRFHLVTGMDLIAGFSREVTGPGQAGLRLNASGRQIIPNADAWFLGIGARVSRLDRSVNPTKGMYVEMNLETGRKERSERRIVGSDTLHQSTILEQERLQAAARVFVPTFARQVFVTGGDAGVLLSSEYDRSDLYRFGGATTLRGYDDDRFLGRIVGRILVEYRFLIDRLSYAYAFIDLGYVDRPRTPDLTPESGLHPGYGIGIQFKTTVGLINVSAGLNPDSGPTGARIHAGLSFGL